MSRLITLLLGCALLISLGDCARNWQEDKQWDVKKMKASCQVSEASIPVVGEMAWQFTMQVDGWDGNKAGCGGGILDNLRGSCKGNIISDWGCDRNGDNRMKLSFKTPKLHNGWCINAALRAASWNRWDSRDLVCKYDYKGSTVKAVFSGLSMAIPIPGAGAAGVVAGVARTAISAGVKAGAQAAKTAATSAAKGAIKGAAKQAAKSGAKNTASQEKQKHDNKKGKRSEFVYRDLDEPWDIQILRLRRKRAILRRAYIINRARARRRALEYDREHRSGILRQISR